MDLKKLYEKLPIEKHSIGFGGCKNNGKNYKCCEYDVTLFDNQIKNRDFFLEIDGEMAKIHHGSLSETSSAVLIQYHNMKILSDEKWELRILLNRVNEKKIEIFRDFCKECLIESLFCVTKTRECIKNSDPFFSLWIKCAALSLSDAIFSINKQRTSPVHMLEYVREFKNDKVNENFSLINEIIGIERATKSLISRMCKSTMGFSDIVERNGHSKIIQQKHDFLVDNSLLSDCYFYLNYINRSNTLKIKSILNRKPELVHILKVGFDFENDSTKIMKYASQIQQKADELMTKIIALPTSANF